MKGKLTRGIDSACRLLHQSNNKQQKTTTGENDISLFVQDKFVNVYSLGFGLLVCFSVGIFLPTVWIIVDKNFDKPALASFSDSL